MGSTLLTIALLHWVALLSPGPNTFVVSNLAASGSRQSAACAAVGIAVVAGIWSTLAALGVNAIFGAHQAVRSTVQIVGGFYLLYLGVRFWRSSTVNVESLQLRLSPLAAFRIGLITNLTNPKSVFFFSSVFATALPSNPSALLAISAVAMSVANALVWHMMLALAFSHRQVQETYARSRKAIGRTAGLVIGAFGLRLLVTAVGQLRQR
jgi:threonine efflux protein